LTERGLTLEEIERKLLHFEARGVGPVGGGGSQVVGRRFTVEWVGGKPSKTSVDEIRLSEFGGKFDKSSDEGFFSRFLGTVKFIGGESSVEVEGISTLIEGGQWVGGWQLRSFLSGGSIGFNVLDCAQSINSGEARSVEQAHSIFYILQMYSNLTLGEGRGEWLLGLLM
jgi:hypothetical protein